MASLDPRFPGKQQTARDRGFLIWVAVLTVASLWPIWGYRFLPMQDYPQHLFIAQVLSTFDSPDYDWPQNYALNSGLGAYVFTYGLLKLFAALTDIEAAGKLLTSLYVLLMAATVLRAARYHASAQAPWALLLIFPFIFNQTYFLGFQSYLLSIPLLFWAVMDLGEFATRPITPRSILYRSIILALLFLTHPFSLLTYLVFGLVLALFNYTDRTMFLKTVIPLAVVMALFVLWYFISSTQANVPGYAWSVRWWPAQGIAAFYFSMFTGMRWYNGVNIYAVVFWASVFGLLLFFTLRDWRHLRFSTPLIVCLALASAGFIILPFWMGYYAYFNLRLAPVTYVLLAWIFANVRVPRVAGHLCAALTTGLVVISINLHAKITEETAQLLPILAKMEKNSAVLPLLLDSRSKVLDPDIFYELHAHDHYYYHLLVGGGVNPLPFPNPMLPLRLRQDRQWPTPQALDQLQPQIWHDVISRYRYVLIRTDNPQPVQQLSQFATVAMHSGMWTLLETQHPQ